MGGLISTGTMTNIITINLDDEAEKLKNKLFPVKGSKGEFSGWVRQKLIEEAEKNNDVDHLVHQIKEKSLKVDELEKEIVLLEKQISLIKNERTLQRQKVQLELEREKPKEKFKDRVAKVSGFIVTYFNLESSQVDAMASELVHYMNENKITNLEIALIRFSQIKGLQFKKNFPFLEKYTLEVTHENPHNAPM